MRAARGVRYVSLAWRKKFTPSELATAEGAPEVAAQAVISNWHNAADVTPARGHRGRARKRMIKVFDIRWLLGSPFNDDAPHRLCHRGPSP